MSDAPQHAPHGFAVQDNCLLVGGIPLPQLADRVGQTPFYAYDRALVSERVAHLRKHLPDAVHLHYAIKANPMPALVQHLAGLVDGFDLASGGELSVALDTTMSPQHISMAGPGKSDAELRRAAAAGITVNIESADELRRLVAASEQLGYRPRVAVRVNPDFELKTAGMKMGGGPKQFGIDAEQVPDVLKDINTMDVDFQGLHIYSGSQNLKVEAIQEAQEKTLELALRLLEHSDTPASTINIGGGFGIPYFPGEAPLDIAPVGERLGELIEQATSQLGDTAVVLELGRYMVGEAGIYVCRVIERKLSRGDVFLVTDGGLHHHLAASGNFGQVIRKNYPVAIGNKMSADKLENASVVGPLCTPLDLLGNKMPLPNAEAGDLVVVFQSGAYGVTASPTRFLSHPLPAETLC